jgi:predicted amidohydrolase YtcJ
VASEYNRNPEGTSQKLLAERPDLDKRYINRVRLGGVKFWLDGSLDTAWFTEPYTVNPPGKEGAFAGYRQIPDEVLDAAFDKYWPTNFQIHMHMNGDAAADQALRAIEHAVQKHGMSDHRPVFIHATWLRKDQIDRMKDCGAIPSFLTAGIASGGDSVVKLWGQERSAGAMAANTFLKRGLPFTFSHDAPVSPVPTILGLVDAGVNRVAGSGTVNLGTEAIALRLLHDIRAAGAEVRVAADLGGTLAAPAYQGVQVQNLGALVGGLAERLGGDAGALLGALANRPGARPAPLPECGPALAAARGGRAGPTPSPRAQPDPSPPDAPAPQHRSSPPLPGPAGDFLRRLLHR